MVVLEEQNYLIKAWDLLADKDTYKPITGGPTSRHKNKHIQTLRTIKAQDGLSDSIYKRLYPTGIVSPNSMVFAKSINVAPPQAYCVQQQCSKI